MLYPGAVTELPDVVVLFLFYLHVYEILWSGH